MKRPGLKSAWLLGRRGYQLVAAVAAEMAPAAPSVVALRLEWPAGWLGRSPAEQVDAIVDARGYAR